MPVARIVDPAENATMPITVTRSTRVILAVISLLLLGLGLFPGVILNRL